MSKANIITWAVVLILIIFGVFYFLRAPQQSQVSNDDGKMAADQKDDAMMMEDTEEKGPIKLGALAPLSGDAASYGVGDQRSKELAVEEINAAGGVNGRMLELVWEDGKCNGSDATTATTKLINVDEVKIILGGGCSGESLAALELTEPAGVLLLSGLSSSPDLSKAGDLFYRTYISDAFTGSSLAKYAREKLSLEKVAIISENTDYAQGLRNTYSATFKDNGGSVVFDENFNTGETDFRTLVTQIKAAEPDVVYISTQTNAPAELIIKQLKEQGVEVTLMGSDVVLERSTIEANPELYEGLYGAELDVSESNPKTGAYVNAYEAKYGEKPEFLGYGAAAYDSVYLVAEAIEKTGSENPKDIAKYFDTQVKDWDGAVGTLNFDETGDVLLGVQIKKVEAGAVTNAL